MKRHALTIALVLGFATPAMADNEGINCIDEGAPGQGAKVLSDAPEATWRRGIGNLGKAFTPVVEPPVLMNTFCEIQNGNGQGPGHAEVD